jgi:site-specific DNA recombinase
MTHEHLYGYVRVSTAKQGERGVSLQEQRDAIERHAARNNLTIARWFEERETAAKQGRPVWNEMLRLLKRREVRGVVIHKIDRSARNLRDWADLGELIDRGLEVHFANESLDLATRGGRLSADIQAVVAADYIRNLREEATKGIYGRLKQGIYPLPAPIGYLDRGSGKAKEIDPAKGPLVRKAFELYASGRYSLATLRTELTRRGLHNRRGRPLSLNGLSVVLNNPFYIGIIRIHRKREVFPGAHAPLIPKRLFDRVQAVLTGKTNTQLQQHEFLLRRLLRCKGCGYSLVGEECKGFRYYRCHTRTCKGVCLREERILAAIKASLEALRFSQTEQGSIQRELETLRINWLEEAGREKEEARMHLAKIQDRLAGLTDALLDGVIDRDLFAERKEQLLMRRREMTDRIAELDRNPGTSYQRLAENLELARDAPLLYETASDDEKREMLLELTSNRTVAGKEVEIAMYPGYKLIAERSKLSLGRPYRDRPRTLAKLLDQLVKIWCKQETGDQNQDKPWLRDAKAEDLAA